MFSKSKDRIIDFKIKLRYFIRLLLVFSLFAKLNKLKIKYTFSRNILILIHQLFKANAFLLLNLKNLITKRIAEIVNPIPSAIHIPNAPIFIVTQRKNPTGIVKTQYATKVIILGIFTS